ncbi:MAG: DUF480 domain-containing protein [Candidatus Eisenbacteria bacterium]|uniref:DUF480 domain-containing protein n=1 Tax=Eiseniibacteriota bacterium TaxID=2212470 RepID=A0A849SB00_UNCEI|nr:DUF480 domain-containing protein [Candidatus Eisenbacteria bacterium]
MTSPPPNAPRPLPAWKPLDAPQRRVLGVLIEKAKTTPAGYPMTLNAIVTGCNQKNNRDPITAYDDIDVGNTLGELATLGVVSEIDWLGRTAKYKHNSYEWLGVSKPELAVLTELLLRGAQAIGDLRVRAARMEPIADLAALKPIVDGLIARRLMIELSPAGRGQIVSHNLYTAHELAELKSRFAGQISRSEPVQLRETGTAERREAAPAGPRETEVAEPSAQIAALRAEVVRLAERVRILEVRIQNVRE